MDARAPVRSSAGRFTGGARPSEAEAFKRATSAQALATMRALERKAPTRSLLALLARLEGAPLPSGEDLADLLGLSRKAAYGVLTRLRQSGVLRTIMVAQPGDWVCECVAYLRVWMTDKAALAALERRLARDPSVTVVAQISGVHDYRLEALHPDVTRAQAWFRNLLTDDAVAQGDLRFTRTVHKRFTTAAALLAGDQESGHAD